MRKAALATDRRRGEGQPIDIVCDMSSFLLFSQLLHEQVLGPCHVGIGSHVLCGGFATRISKDRSVTLVVA